MKKQRLTEKNVKLGKKLRQFREKAGLTQEALADKANLTQTYVSMLERGKRGISMTTLQKIARELKVKAGDLLPF